VTERTLSIKAGLAASTVTPGITAPDESRTTPVMAPVCDCAHTVAGRQSKHHETTTSRAFIASLHFKPSPGHPSLPIAALVDIELVGLNRHAATLVGT
jgi:hypothetical protein